MPKRLHEIKGFNVGTITTPSETDIISDAASYSLDIASNNVDGKLSGRNDDKYYASNSFVDTYTSTAASFTITTVADSSSNLSQTYFYVSLPTTHCNYRAG